MGFLTLFPPILGGEYANVCFLKNLYAITLANRVFSVSIINCGCYFWLIFTIFIRVISEIRAQKSLANQVLGYFIFYLLCEKQAREKSADTSAQITPLHIGLAMCDQPIYGKESRKISVQNVDKIIAQ